MRFIVEELKIQKFRKLEKINIKLGKNITVFSGINGVGKSNIISLIAMAFGTPGRRLVGGDFFPHFDEYFVITESEFSEQQKEGRYEAHLKISTEEGHIYKRLGLKNDTNRGRGIRVLPRASNYFVPQRTVEEIAKETKDKYQIGDSARVPVPTIFISLSRLFPIGETGINEKGLREDNIIIRQGVVDKYIDWYNYVLPGSIDKSNYKTSKIKKNVDTLGRVHVELTDSSTETQSVGEDNLGSIVSALIDFYYLKLVQGESYNGGILCIDELDASLHPSAQLKLFDLLDRLSEELELQIFISTHSMTLLDKIINKQNRNKDKYRLVYLLDPRFPRVKEKIKRIEDIKSDMFDNRNYYEPKIKIYCEDEETQFIFDELMKIVKSSNEIKIPEYKVFVMSLGHNQLENLVKFDGYFENVVMLVDGDAKAKDGKNLLNKYLENDINGLSMRRLEENVLSLPTHLAPESYYYYILKQVLDDREFWRQLEELDLKENYTSYNLKIILDKVGIEEGEEISNNQLKEVFKGEILARIRQFIRETQVLKYYYTQKKPKEFDRFRKDVVEVFKIVESRVKSNFL